MVDSGAKINLLKKSNLPKKFKPYAFGLILREICGGKSSTLEVVKYKIGKISTIFHVIDDEDQSKWDEILSAEFFGDSDVSIPFGNE